MKIKKITDKIFLATFPGRKELCSTLMRFEEYYESPVFRGKIFTREEFIEWYTKNSPRGIKTGKFTYNIDWYGFNLPSYVLKPFYAGKFNPLSPEEKLFLKAFEKYLNEDFYVIALYGNAEKCSYTHEIAHGLFYTNKSYRNEALKIIKTIDKETLLQIEEFFTKYCGYHKDVWPDEMHASIMTETGYLKRKGIDVKKLRAVHDKLDVLFHKYCP